MRKIVLLIILLINPQIALSQMKYHIQWEDQFSKWQHYQTQHHLPSAVRTAKSRYKSTGKRQRVVDIPLHRSKYLEKVHIPKLVLVK